MRPSLDQRRVRRVAVGAFMVGALAVGALAVGTLAIGNLVVGRARFRRVDVDELVVGRIVRKTG